MSNQIRKIITASHQSLALVLDNPEFLRKAMNIWSENKALNMQVQLLKIQNEKEIHLLTERYETYREIITQIFGERHIALTAHYKVLDKAMESNDRGLIIESLKGISSIVTNNPLQNFAEFSRILDDENETLELDF